MVGRRHEKRHIHNTITLTYQHFYGLLGNRSSFCLQPAPTNSHGTLPGWQPCMKYLAHKAAVAALLKWTGWEALRQLLLPPPSHLPMSLLPPSHNPATTHLSFLYYYYTALPCPYHHLRDFLLSPATSPLTLYLLPQRRWCDCCCCCCVRQGHLVVLNPEELDVGACGQAG